MDRIASEAEVQQIVSARHPDPFEVLGMHPVRADGRQRIVVRAFLPGADSVRVVPRDGSDEAWSMYPLHSDGFFEGVIQDRPDLFDYQLDVAFPYGVTRRLHDPYGFPPVLSDYDLYLCNEGSNARVYDNLGAHPRPHCGVFGVAFEGATA